MRSEIQGSSGHIKDLSDQPSHAQPPQHDPSVQENARSNATASLSIGQAHVEPITSALPHGGGEGHATQESRIYPHAQCAKSIVVVTDSINKEIFFCDVLTASEISSKASNTPSQLGRRTTHMKSVSSQQVQRNFSVWKRQVAATRSRQVGIWNLYILQHFPEVEKVFPQ